jgi:hypothetical protein
MGKPVLIKDKKQEVFDKAQSTLKGRKLLTTLEDAKDNYENYLKSCDKVRELAIEADFTIEETNLLALMVLEKANFSTYYKRKAISILNPPSKIPDYSKLANKALLSDPMKALDDKTLYEGDYELFIPYTILNKRIITHMARGNEGWYLRIRNGKPQNAKNDIDGDWMILEDYEVEADLERKELEAAIN